MSNPNALRVLVAEGLLLLMVIYYKNIDTYCPANLVHKPRYYSLSVE